MLQKQYKFQIKSVSEEGKFTGLAAAYGNLDSDSEVIDVGCFKRSISHSGGKGIPVCWTHDLRTPIAWGTLAEERKEGLYVEAQFLLNTEQGRTAYEWAKMGSELGANVGISVGFRPTKDGTYFKDGIRHFRDAQLVEYSLCVVQANSLARVATVKENKPNAIRDRAAEYMQNNKDFTDALTEQRAMNALYEERCELDRALCSVVHETLDSDALTVDEQKSQIATSYTQYADAMSDWYARFIDADGDGDQGEDDEENMDKHEKSGRTISRATSEKIMMAMGHFQKGLGVLQDMSERGYTRNDVNQPNPVGGGSGKSSVDPEEKKSEESDPELHSLLAQLEALGSRIR